MERYKMVKTGWETQEIIEVGYRVWFHYDSELYSGYVQKVNDDQTLKIAVYYINDVALGKYKIVDEIHRLDIYQWEKKHERKKI
jgi:hypothetical protein